MVPEDLRYVPQVKSDIVIQRRQVEMAPVEGMNVYQRDGTNTITFNVQGHKTTNQLLDTKSCFFTCQCKFRNGYPVEDVANLVEEIIVSSNGRVLERIRHAQYIQWFMKQYNMSRESKRRLGEREGYSKFEDPTLRTYHSTQEDYPVLESDGSDPTANLVNKIKLGDAEQADATTTPNPRADLIAQRIPQYSSFAWVRDKDTATNAQGWRDTQKNDPKVSRYSDQLGYSYFQVNRDFDVSHDDPTGQGGMVRGWPAQGVDQAGTSPASGTGAGFGWKTMKFRIKCSGLLACEKMLPIGWMPLTIQLRLSDKMRCTDKGDINFDYAIKKPRMHFSVCTVGQAYASAMQQRLRGPGITINAKLFDTHFKIIDSDEQIVIPCNKQRLSKVYIMLHDNASVNDPTKNAFRSSVTGSYVTQYGLRQTTKNAAGAITGAHPTGGGCLQSYQFQVGTEVSEPVTLEDTSKSLENIEERGGGEGGSNPNSGMAFLEEYLKSIGAVNGHEQDVEFWGRQLDSRCNPWEGGDLLKTFLAKYFVAVYNGEKFLGDQVESGVDTEAGKDIVVDLRFSGNGPANAVRVQALIQYHAQFVIKENSVELSY